MSTVPFGKRPDTYYVNAPVGWIAYQVFGSDGPDIVFVTGAVSNIDAIWDEPSAARYLNRLGTMGRVIMLDKRGSGVSDPYPSQFPEPVENSLIDITTVLDEVGSETAVLLGETEGGIYALILAATYPERFPTLILVNTTPRLRRAPDYPIGAPDDVIEALAAGWSESYGVNADALSFTAPSTIGDARFTAWWPRYQRLSMAKGTAHNALSWIAQTDVRAVLPTVQAETLVLHGRHNQYHRLAFGEFVAENIPGATLRVVDSSDSYPFHAGNFNLFLDEIEEFLTGARTALSTDRKLATVMFTDIVGSTAMAAKMGDDRWLDLRTEHDRVITDRVQLYGGSELSFTGDGCVATFDSPYRAIQCSQAIHAELETIGIQMRAGLHTGEIEVREGELGGIAVHIAARVMSVAEAGGLLASSTVRDLVVGAGLEFAECGVHELKGVPGSWQLYEVRATA